MTPPSPVRPVDLCVSHSPGDTPRGPGRFPSRRRRRSCWRGSGSALLPGTSGSGPRARVRGGMAVHRTGVCGKEEGPRRPGPPPPRAQCALPAQQPGDRLPGSLPAFAGGVASPGVREGPVPAPRASVCRWVLQGSLPKGALPETQQTQHEVPLSDTGYWLGCSLRACAIPPAK